METCRQTIVNQDIVYRGGCWEGGVLLQVKHFIKMSVKRPRTEFIFSTNLRQADRFFVETISELRQQLYSEADKHLYHKVHRS